MIKLYNKFISDYNKKNTCYKEPLATNLTRTNRNNATFIVLYIAYSVFIAKYSIIKFIKSFVTKYAMFL